MAAQVPSGPQNGVAYIFYLGLRSQANSTVFQANPTLATGDVKVSIDGGALANITTLPTVTPAAGKMVKVSLSASEMTGDNITVVFSDAAGAEWFDEILNIQTGQYRSIVVDANGLADANAVKVGPSGSGTAQTASNLSTLLTTALTESYAADGAAATAAQLLYLILATRTEFAVSGTTMTAKKLDGSTAAATFTLDSASAPTSITRAS